MNEIKAKMAKLSEIADLTVGYVGTMGKEYSDYGVAFLRSLNIKPYSFDLSDLKYISDEFHQKLRKSELHKDDVVIVRTGIPGTCAVIPTELDGCNCADLVIVRPNVTLVDPHYLCAFINSWGKAQVANSKVGAVQKHFNVTAAEEMIIPLFDLSTQRTIGKVLHDLNSKISYNKSISSTLESLTKTIYDYWFVQFNFPDENGKPYKSSGGKMVWNEELKREIPDGWRVNSANTYLNIVKGISYSANDIIEKGIKMINLNSFNEDGSYKVEGIKIFSRNVSDEKVLLPNDLIMCATQQTNIDLSGRKNVIGKTLLVPNLDGKMTFSMDVVKLTSHKKKYLPFFKYQFGLPYAHKYIVGYANGTKIKHLDVVNALSLPVAMPGKNSSLIDDFSDYAFAVNNRISMIIRENEKLASLRDFLLPMLMNGQVKVGGEQ